MSLLDSWPAANQNPESEDVDQEEEESSDSGTDESHIADNAPGDGNSSSPPDGSPPDTFHSFMKLPPELRRVVWEMFCPDLTLQPRVLYFMDGPATEVHMRQFKVRQLVDENKCRISSIKAGIFLDDSTRLLRTTMAVHHESRAQGLAAFPDTLTMDVETGSDLVRYSKARDIVRLEQFRYLPWNYHHSMPGFAEVVEQVAVDAFKVYASMITAFSAMPNLKRVFFQCDYILVDKDQIGWCSSPDALQYQLSWMEDMGYGVFERGMLCVWPDVDQHIDFARYSVPKMHMRYNDHLPQFEEFFQSRGIEHFPQLVLDDTDAEAEYHRLNLGPGEDLQPASSDADEDGPSDEFDSDDSDALYFEGHYNAFPHPHIENQDEYESEGIDDDEIVEGSSSEEDEMVPRAISTGGSSSADTQPGEQAGNFSSPEPDTNEEPAAEHQRRPKRRVVDSDDEDEMVEGPAAKRPRMGASRVLESDEEDDNGSVKGTHESEGDEDEQAPGRQRAGQAPIMVEDSSEDDDEDRKEEYPAPALSLPQRLAKFRRENPVSESSEGSSGDEDDENEDRYGYGEDEDDDEEDSEGDRNSLIDDMAADSDEDDEDGSEEDY